MKILCDVHISYRLINFLKNRGIHAVHINYILDKWNTTDADISRYADENDMMLITKDSDFRDSFFLNHTPKKLIRVTLGNVSNNDLISIFDENLEVLRENYKKKLCYIEMAKGTVSIIVFD